MLDPNCIFCKIINKEIPTNLIYEDDDSLAFLDIHPVAKGHTLLVPKDHHRWFTDMPDADYNKLFLTAKRMAEKLKQDYTADYVRLGVVGKDVPHVHIHLVPQKMTDEGPAI